VAVRPSDGALLTVASGPGSSGVASTATQALYEPGSTFKTVSGLAMLRHGLMPTSTLPCTPSITVDGYTFDNDEGYPSSALGTIPWTKAFAHSCNTAVISQADTVSQADLASAAAALGLTVPPSIVVPAMTSRVPATASGATEHAASMIGQGKVLVSPLGMAAVTASIAKGDTVRPVLVTGDAATSPAPTASGSPAPTASESPVAAQPITAQEAEDLRTLMRGVVTEGTAQSALAGTPGGPIMAKTGTATYTVDGQQRWHVWLIAIQGDLAVSVLVADGDYGASTCGPLLKQFLTVVNAG
jgi:cell division protein FtsI/penicillin-binding protein 2